MSKLFTTLLRICLFRAKPQDLPGSTQLLGITIFSALIVFMIRNNELAVGDNLIMLTGVQVAFLGISFRILLGFFSKSERWLQSATALYGCSAIIVATIIPFLATTDMNAFEAESLSTAKIMIIFASVWYFATVVYILRETLEISIVFAFIISLVLELAMASLILQIFSK